MFGVDAKKRYCWLGILFLLFWEVCILFSIETEPNDSPHIFLIKLNATFCLKTICPKRLFPVFVTCYSHWCRITPYCLDLHFPNHKEQRALYHMPVSHVYDFFGKYLLILFHYFGMGYYIFVVVELCQCSWYVVYWPSYLMYSVQTLFPIW